MFVTLEVSKLSGWLNADAPCRESKGRHTVRGDVRPGRAGGSRRPRCTQRAGETRLQMGGRARGGAHVEHLLHVRDAGGVKAQRLVERRRVLPRVERRAYDLGRGARYREAGGGGRPRCKRRAGEGSTADWEQHGEERTQNMPNIVVTLDVFQLERSSLKFPKP